MIHIQTSRCCICPAVSSFNYLHAITANRPTGSSGRLFSADCRDLPACQDADGYDLQVRLRILTGPVTTSGV